ncbi:MAG TPA: TlpA family protein disulfide reductase [Desulfobulbus sp.]|nr:TlpA family protein disulfide reductase [Desulfobulbus sp.]
MSYKKKTGTLLVLACIMGTLLVASVAGAAVNMPDFALPSALDGKVVKSSSFRGKAMLVTFFATWCPPCRQEIPTLKKLQEEYGDKGFSVIGLSVDEGGPKVVAKLIRKEAINYPVLMADRATANDFGGIAGIPTSFLINRKGHVVKRYPGYVPHALLVKDIESIL